MWKLYMVFNYSEECRECENKIVKYGLKVVYMKNK